MRHFLLLILVFCITITATAQRILNPEFDALLKKELNHNVPEMEVRKLRNEKGITLLDVRSQKEYNVSHIEGALFIDFVQFGIEDVKTLDKKTPIVVYCSVGSRSEKVAQLLIENDFQEVHNLYGGIFEWSNQQFPLVDTKQNQTLNIHGVTKIWSKWIDHGNVVLD